jgi:hypothetical protein
MPALSNKKKPTKKAAVLTSAAKTTSATATPPLTPPISTPQPPTLLPTAATEPEPLLIDNTISFACFINQADLANMKHFLKATRSGQEAFILKTLWVHAFLEEKKVKQAEEYKEGYEAGY